MASLGGSGSLLTPSTPCEDTLRELPSHPPDIIFLDASSSARNERILLESLRGHPATRQIPIIILSDRTAGQLAMDGINLGPLEYLVPCQLGRDMDL